MFGWEHFRLIWSLKGKRLRSHRSGFNASRGNVDLRDDAPSGISNGPENRPVDYLTLHDLQMREQQNACYAEDYMKSYLVHVVSIPEQPGPPLDYPVTVWYKIRP